MFDGAEHFSKAAAVIAGGAIIGFFFGAGWPVLLGAGIALYLTLGYYNDLEQRDIRDANQKKKRRQ